MENNNAEEYIFNSPNYVHMVIEYSGKIPEEKDKSKERPKNLIFRSLFTFLIRTFLTDTKQIRLTTRLDQRSSPL